MKKKKLLSIDWDYFFPEPWGMKRKKTGHDFGLYDWGHREAPFFCTDIWPLREAAFKRANIDLPQTSGEEVGFWDRFTFSKDAGLFLSDSHAFASDKTVLDGVNVIWNYDAHHDGGYRPSEDIGNMSKGIVDCGNWFLYSTFLKDAEAEQRYPKWKDAALDVEEPPYWMNARFAEEGEGTPIFDRVFICRSSAWVPPWLDAQFETFWKSCPVPVVKVFESPTDPSKPREHTELGDSIANLELSLAT